MRETQKIKHLPRCYSFSFDAETVTLYFKVQKWIVPTLQKQLLTEDNKIYTGFGLKGKAFGLNNILQWHEETEEELIYSYKLVPALERTNLSCLSCGGKKKSKCYESGNTKKIRSGLLLYYISPNGQSQKIIEHNINSNTFNL